MLGRMICVAGNPLRASIRQFSHQPSFLTQRRAFSSSSPSPDPAMSPSEKQETGSLDPPFTEVDESISRVRLPGEFSQQDYRYACAQRLSSVDHPSGTIFLLPWDKGRLLPLEQDEEPFAPESRLPLPRDRLHDPYLARTAQRLTKDLRVQNLLLEIHAAEEWLPEEDDRPADEPSLEELLRERLQGSGVQIHLHKTPEVLHTIQPHQVMKVKQMDIAFKDVRANATATKMFLGEKYQRSKQAQAAFEEMLVTPGWWPRQLRQELIYMQWRILNELIYTNNNMIGWEVGRQVMRAKVRYQSRHLLDQVRDILETHRGNSPKDNNLLIVLPPLIVREILRTCNDELKFPITCIAPYALDNLPMTTVHPPVRDLSQAAWPAKPLYDYTGESMVSKRFTNLLERTGDDPIHIIRHLWMCFARQNRGAPKMEPTRGILFRQRLAEWQEKGVYKK